MPTLQKSAYFPFFKLSLFKGHVTGQSIATSAEVTLNGGLVRESPNNAFNSGLGIIVIWPDVRFSRVFFPRMSSQQKLGSTISNPSISVSTPNCIS